jgi:hypothetical protein
MGRLTQAAAEHELRRLSDVEDDAFTALCAHPCATIEEGRAKAAYIVAHTDFLAVQEYQFEALLRSFLI